MAVNYRKDRQKWGFRKFSRGKTYRRYRWDSKEEAETAYRTFLVGLDSRPNVPPQSLVEIVNGYLADSRMKGRSKWRLQALSLNFSRFVVPFFGASTDINTITHVEVERFMVEQKQRGVKNSTIWHYVTDLRALYNWAIRYGLAERNPVTRADMSIIPKARYVDKRPMDPERVERAAACLDGRDRAMFDCFRFTGLRLDELNRLKWTDLELDEGWFYPPGTKTANSSDWLPLPDELVRELRELREITPGTYVFPNRRHPGLDRYAYKRDKLFKKIEKLTGVKLTAKDLRDYFATMVDAPVEVKMRLLRHTSMTTTTRYLRRVNSRLRDAVRDLGTNRTGHQDSDKV